MNYLLKSSSHNEKKKSTKRKILVAIIILVIFTVTLISDFGKQSLFSLASPIWKLKSIFANSHLAEYFKTKKFLIDEKIMLEQKLFKIGDLIAVNENLYNENNTLKDLLDRKETKTDTILGTILVKPPQTPYDILTIDVGENYNIKIGNKVVASANVYIGEVSEVYNQTSKVKLYSSPGTKLSVALGINAVSVDAIGIGGGNFNIFLPREVEVKEGDVIVTPSITANIFGIVEKVNFKDQDSFQTILFKSPVNIAELNFVEVILSN